MQHTAVAAGTAQNTLLFCKQNLLSLAILLCLPFFCLAQGTGTEATEQKAGMLQSSTQGWVSMPSGARTAFFGIHGGTVPVSLLVTSTGTSLVSFVGETGNDFLALLRKAEMRFPSFFFSSRDNDQALSGQKADIRAILCRNTEFCLPVISLSDDSVFKMTATPGLLQPFGFSDSTKNIEGDVSMPSSDQGRLRYHILVDPDYLVPHEK